MAEWEGRHHASLPWLQPDGQWGGVAVPPEGHAWFDLAARVLATKARHVHVNLALCHLAPSIRGFVFHGILALSCALYARFQACLDVSGGALPSIAQPIRAQDYAL